MHPAFFFGLYMLGFLSLSLYIYIIYRERAQHIQRLKKASAEIF